MRDVVACLVTLYMLNVQNTMYARLAYVLCTLDQALVFVMIGRAVLCTLHIHRMGLWVPCFCMKDCVLPWPGVKWEKGITSDILSLPFLT